MPAAVNTIQKVAIPGVRRLHRDAPEKVYYSPEVDAHGKVYFVSMTETKIAEEIVKEKKKGNIKTYTIKEVRQKLGEDLGFKI